MFKIGDKVKCIKEYDFNKARVGKVGTVIGICKDLIGVEFEDNFNGHNSSLTGCKGKNGHCWNFPNTSEFLKSALTDTVVITNDGRVTTATLRNGKTVLNKAISTCCQDDEFSQYEGTRIALARLFNEEPFSVTGVKKGKQNHCFWKPFVDLTKIEPIEGKISKNPIVGDVVKITKSIDGRFNVDELYVVDEVTKSGVIVKHHLGKTNGRAILTKNEFEVVNVKTVSRKPREGDLVKLTSNGGYNFVDIGNVVRVSDLIGGGRILVRGNEFDYDEPFDGSKGWCFLKNEFVILEEDTISNYREVNRNPQVGDKIKITDGWMMIDYKKGDILTVKSINDINGVYTIENKSYISRSEFKVLEEI